MLTLLGAMAVVALLIIAAPLIGALLSFAGGILVTIFWVLFPILLIGGLVGYFIGKKKR